jgi:hypothetical protein
MTVAVVVRNDLLKLWRVRFVEGVLDRVDGPKVG